ncbi:MAG TPA: outer membrane protein assembly factor [Acetobacteraceae bacterium]|jgi:translocation and assembly module TamA|nr:outer membrane protein assembly factor [Acetobacteraceae bacterium]
MRRLVIPMTAVRWFACALSVVAAVALGSPADAADPQPYTVSLKPTGNAALDAALNGSSTLISLQTSAPVAGFALTERARLDAQRFETALRAFGYYKATVTTTIGGHPLDDPALPSIIDAAPADPPFPVIASFDLGPQFKIGKVTIATPVPADIAGHLNLAPGQPAMAAEILGGQGRLTDALRADGYPLAKVPPPVAILHPEQNLLDVTFQPETGPKADIGPISLKGLKDMNESFVRQRLLLHQGELFTPQAIEAARSDLSSIGVFSVVRAVPATALDPNGQLPVTFDLTERPLHAVDLGVGYSTDLGANLTTAWHDRNLFGNAEQLNLIAAYQAGGNALVRPGYQVGAQFLKPDFLTRDQQLEVDLNAVQQSLQAYDQTALMEKIALNRKLSPYWTASLGLSGEQESIVQEGVTRHYNLLGVPGSLKYDSTTNLLDPTSGVRAALLVTPTASIGTTSEAFVIAQISGSTYLDVFHDGRSVVALRGLVGQASGVGVFGLPPDQRFYAGGSATVRGYRYQTLGPQFPDQRPIGGTAISTGTVELRQRILGNYGVVGFMDVGQVSSNGAPFNGNWRAGAGIGARYYTAIGPIRLDVAVPLQKLPGGDSFEVYIGIGQAF